MKSSLLFGVVMAAILSVVAAVDWSDIESDIKRMVEATGKQQTESNSIDAESGKELVDYQGPYHVCDCTLLEI